MASQGEIPRSRRGVKLAATIALGAIAAVGVVAITGSAQAGRIDPAIAVGPGPGGTVSIPPFTLVTVPPTLTIPPFTLVTIPTTGGGATTTTTEPTDSTEPTESTDSTEPTETTGGSGSPGPTEQYAVTVTAAQVECDGTIHVEYETTAQPQPPLAANHLVVFNPTSNPADFHVVETEGNPANGSFIFGELGSIEDSYRVYVVVDFDPSGTAGPIAVAEADVVSPPTC